VRVFSIFACVVQTKATIIICPCNIWDKWSCSQESCKEYSENICSTKWQV